MTHESPFTITVHDPTGEVVKRHEIHERAEDGHDEGTCSMWCQRCYVEACGAPEQPDWSPR